MIPNYVHKHYLILDVNYRIQIEITYKNRVIIMNTQYLHIIKYRSSIYYFNHTMSFINHRSDLNEEKTCVILIHNNLLC